MRRRGPSAEPGDLFRREDHVIDTYLVDEAVPEFILVTDLLSEVGTAQDQDQSFWPEVTSIPLAYNRAVVPS